MDLHCKFGRKIFPILGFSTSLRQELVLSRIENELEAFGGKSERVHVEVTDKKDLTILKKYYKEGKKYKLQLYNKDKESLIEWKSSVIERIEGNTIVIDRLK